MKSHVQSTEENEPMAQFNDIPKNIADLIAAHTQLYLVDPERAHLWDATPVGVPGLVPTLLLTTTGRKSGTARHVPLLYLEHGGGYLIVGSRGGSPGHPEWYLNLTAHPDCQIRVGAKQMTARTRVIQGEERAPTWKAVTAAYPVYARYQARTDREIPLILLVPASS
jgi:deazaflavin-dependent oxidoreductase (nitroreductase family)